MKQLYLTAIGQIPNKQGIEKIETAKSPKSKNNPNWESMGLRPPRGEADIDEDGRVWLEDEDLEMVYLSVVIPLDLYAGAKDDVERGTAVYTTGGKTHRVLESADEVANYAEMLDLHWLQREYIYYKAKIKNYLTKQQKQESNE